MPVFDAFTIILCACEGRIITKGHNKDWDLKLWSKDYQSHRVSGLCIYAIPCEELFVLDARVEKRGIHYHREANRANIFPFLFQLLFFLLLYPTSIPAFQDSWWEWLLVQVCFYPFTTCNHSIINLHQGLWWMVSSKDQRLERNGLPVLWAYICFQYFFSSLFQCFPWLSEWILGL